MSAILIDGKSLAAKVKEEVRLGVASMRRKPGLAVIIVGNDPASRIYVDGKKRDCDLCGIYSEEHALPETIGQEQVLDLIEQLNEREEIDGILVQLPLPDQLNARTIMRAIRPDKDVDSLHPYNVGKLLNGEEGSSPCTPAGVIRMLEEYGVDPAGKNCVVIGRSNLVGKPMAVLMLRKNATVTICHTATADLADQCRRADILISAAGCEGLVTPDMIKPGAVIIDVAINRRNDGTLCGDVCGEAADIASKLTPVPGGVGPMTRAMLMKNTLYAARNHGK